jgi:hypothetical protein
MRSRLDAWKRACPTALDHGRRTGRRVRSERLAGPACSRPMLRWILSAHGSLRVRSIVARGCAAASPAALAFRRRLTLLSLGGEARRQVGSQRAAGAPEPGRRGGSSLRHPDPRAAGAGVVAADRAHRRAADARSCWDSRARVHPRHPVARLDAAHAPAHTTGHRSQPVPQPDQEAARPVLPRPAAAPPLAVAVSPASLPLRRPSGGLRPRAACPRATGAASRRYSGWTPRAAGTPKPSART